MDLLRAGWKTVLQTSRHLVVLHCNAFGISAGAAPPSLQLSHFAYEKHHVSMLHWDASTWRLRGRSPDGKGQREISIWGATYLRMKGMAILCAFGLRPFCAGTDNASAYHRSEQGRAASSSRSRRDSSRSLRRVPRRPLLFPESRSGRPRLQPNSSEHPCAFSHWEEGFSQR